MSTFHPGQPARITVEQGDLHYTIEVESLTMDFETSDSGYYFGPFAVNGPTTVKVGGTMKSAVLRDRAQMQEAARKKLLGSA